MSWNGKKNNDILQSCYYNKDHAKISTNVYGIYVYKLDWHNLCEW